MEEGERGGEKETKQINPPRRGGRVRPSPFAEPGRKAHERAPSSAPSGPTRPRIRPNPPSPPVTVGAQSPRTSRQYSGPGPHRTRSPRQRAAPSRPRRSPAHGEHLAPWARPARPPTARPSLASGRRVPTPTPPHNFGLGDRTLDGAAGVWEWRIRTGHSGGQPLSRDSQAAGHPSGAPSLPQPRAATRSAEPRPGSPAQRPCPARALRPKRVSSPDWLL